jgi:probable F420-dependent oxidoreductase
MNLGVAVGNLGFSIGRLIDPVEHAALVYRTADQAERLGFHSVWVGDHLALPRVGSTPYPYGGSAATLDPETSMLDPFAVLAALAGRTQRVRLGLGVLVAPYRHPLVSAKLIASIDALSGGRVIVGVGTGWMPEEFAAVGADFAARGRDTDACLRYLTQVFAEGEIDGMTVLPRPVQRPRPPIWVGGNATAAMRRAVAFGDGWDAPYADPRQLEAGIDRLRALCRSAGRDPSSLGLSVRGIPAARVDAALLGTYAALGVTEVGVTLPYHDVELALSTLEQLARRCAGDLFEARNP